MRPEQIELIATAHLKSVLSRISELKIDIFENDKTPFVDGSICVYKETDNKQIPKQNILHEVRVQVKGVTTKTIYEKNKERVSVKDLKGFTKLLGGGCLYFIVYIENEIAKKIYYREFQPYSLNELITRYGEQGTVSLDFKEFPKSKNEIKNLLKTFAINVDLQPKELINANISNIPINEVTIKYYGSPNDYEAYINSGPIIYTKINGDISVPVGKVIPNSKHLFNYIDIKLEDDTILKGKIIRNDNLNTYTIVIDETLTITVKDKRIDFSVKMDESFNLEKITTSINNVEKIFNKGFYIGENLDVFFEVASYLKDTYKDIFKDLFEFRDEMKKIIDMLKELNVDTNINYYKLNDDEKMKLHNIVDTFTKEEKGIKIITLEITDKLYYFIKTPTLIGNIFFTKNSLSVYTSSNIDGKKVTINLLPSIVPRKNLEKVLDFDTDEVFKDIEQIFTMNQGNINVSGPITDYLLDIIRNFDSSKEKSFLELSNKIAEKILGIDKSITSYINYYQIIRRSRDLSITEKEHLQSMLDISTKIEEICIRILLCKPIEKELKALETTDRESLVEWPIFSLYVE